MCARQRERAGDLPRDSVETRDIPATEHAKRRPFPTQGTRMGLFLLETAFLFLAVGPFLLANLTRGIACLPSSRPSSDVEIVSGFWIAAPSGRRAPF